MADNVNANINIDINSSAAIADLRKLQAQIGAFSESVIASNAAAAQAQKDLNRQLISQVSAIKGFSSSIVTVQSDMSRLSTAIDKQRLSLGEYFRYGMASTRSFGRLFAKEHNEVMGLAEDRVKRLSTQYVALGESQNGLTRALATRPMQLFNADMAIATQRSQLFNKLLHDGSTALVNWGKNTQWAGRQLMVGFSLPIAAFGTVAGKTFMDLEKQVIAFQRVYGDLGTTVEETDVMVEKIKTLGEEYTKYGIAVSDTIGLASKAAASGAQGADLIAATEQATRLATLGMIDQEQALTATIALQSAFRMSSEELARSIDFLNAVENQTVVSLDDITVAIPKVAPVIQGLGGDIDDLAAFMAAMREGGVNAAEGANALKSGLASLINPTKNASEMLKRAGINMDDLIKKNRGDLMGLVQDFGAELQNLDKFSRQQVLAKVFGKYQFARMGALFENINRDGSQAQRVIDLTGESMQDLAALSEKELGKISEATSTKFLAAIEKLKLAIAPIGEQFLKVATPVVEWLTKIADKFNELPSYAKNFIVIGTAIAAVLIPSVIMIVGLMANFLGNMVKIGAALRSFIGRIRGSADAFNYMSTEELDAAAAARSLDGRVTTLTAHLNIQRESVNKLAAAYTNMARAASTAMANLPQGFRGPMGRAPRKMATGGFVSGQGNKDTEPAMLTPGEFVVNKDAAEQFGPLLEAINSGKVKAYGIGGEVGRTVRTHLTDRRAMSLGDAQQLDIIGNRAKETLNIVSQVEQILGRSVSSVALVSNFVVEMSEAFNRDMKSGMPSAEFASRFGAAGVDKYQVTAGVTKEDFATLKPHFDKLDSLILEVASEFETIGDANIDQIVKEAFSRLDPASREALKEIEGLATEFNNLRLTVSRLDKLTEEEKAKLAAHGITVDSNKERTIISTPTGRASVRSRQETIPTGRTYKDSDLRFNDNSISADLIQSAKDSAMKAGVESGTEFWWAFGKTLKKKGVTAAQALNAALMEGLDPELGVKFLIQSGFSPSHARDVASRFTQAARDEIGANSPATDGIDLVGDFVDGMAVGANENTADAARAGKVVNEAFAQAATVLPAMPRIDETAQSASELRSQLGSLPASSPTAERLRIGSYGGQASVLNTIAAKENPVIEQEVARLRALQVDEKQILARVIEIETGEIAQRKIALQAAIDRKENATRLAALGTAEANVGATTPAAKPAVGFAPVGSPLAAPSGFAGPASDISSREVIPESLKNSEQTVKKIDRVGASIAGLSSKIAGVSVAATMAAGAFASMEGPVGQFAQGIFPLLGFLDLLTIPMMFIGGGGGAAAGAGLGAMGAGGAAAGAGISAALGPIAAIAAAIAGLIVVFKIVYDRFEPLRIAVDGLMETIGNLTSIIFNDLIAAFKDIFGITDKAGASIGGFEGILQGLANVVGPVLATAFDVLSNIVAVVGNAIRVTIKYWQAFFSVLKMAANIIRFAIGKAISWLMDKLGPIGDAIKGVGEKVAETFSNIGPIISSAVSNAGKFIENAVNIGINAINKLIEAYNALPFGDDVATLDKFTFAGPSQGDTNAAYYGTGDTYSGMTAGDYRKRANELKQEDQGLLPEDTGGAGEKQKSWLQELAAQVAANYALFVDDVDKGRMSAMDKLRAIQPSVPEQLLAAIGAGPDGLKNAREFLNADAKKRAKLVADWTKATVGQTVSNLVAKRKEAQQKNQATQILQDNGFTKEQADQIAGNSEDAFAIVSAAAGKAGISLKNLLKNYKDLNSESDQTAESQMGWLRDVMDMQAIQHRQEMQSIDKEIKRYQDQIKAIETEIDAIKKLNQADQDRIEALSRQKEMIGRQIEQLERANEMDNRRIETLKREDEIRNRTADSINHELDLLGKQETKIKDVYDKRINSLEQVAKINDYLINQQKTQLNLAQSLSSGDVYAAAQAQQEMQAQQIQMAQDQQKQGLEQARDNAIAGLTTASGLTRAQAEEQVNAIKEQSYQTSLKIRDIEDAIYQRNKEMVPLKDQQYNLDKSIQGIQDVIYTREQQIKDIENQRLEPVKTLLDNAQKTKQAKEDEYQAIVDSQNALLDQAKLSDLQKGNVEDLAKRWRAVGDAILEANKAMDRKISALGPEPKWTGGSKKDYAAFENNLKDFNAKKQRIIDERNAAVDAAKGSVAKMATGGLVTGAGGMDSRLTALTPGEFVVRKAMVRKYGEGMFQNINQGSFSMPRYAVAQPVAVDSGSASNVASIHAPVYNTYSVNVPVTQPNASADEIANKVITKIRNIEKGSVRRINAY